MRISIFLAVFFLAIASLSTGSNNAPKVVNEQPIVVRGLLLRPELEALLRNTVLSTGETAFSQMVRELAYSNQIAQRANEEQLSESDSDDEESD